MKRQLVNKEEFLLLPNELLIELVRLDEWYSSGPLARCSKDLLYCMTKPDILREIIETIKINDRHLLRWLTFAIPGEWIDSKHYPTQLQYPLIEENLCELDFIWEVDLRKGSFLSGGFVCQKVYNIEWECDTDIFVNHPDERRIEYETATEKNYDICAKPLENIERVIENFDLSIVQQGFLNQTQFYLTPLALYTYTNKEIIAMPKETNIQYQWTQIVGEGYVHHTQRTWKTTDIWYYLKNHMKHKKQPFLTDCPECGYCSHHDVILKWDRRLQKYCRRFPDFTLAYCHPPN